uniref:Meiotic double-stranded break formation protein 4 n=1 Tax=Salvator merianae TaxID=96440 RepID=A0A8D0DVV1_SALMN
RDILEDVIWYLKASQLALALAIIRSKPPDKSSKEFAEHLAKIVSGQDSKWKSRVEALEAEVLHLRQQLLLSKISSGLCSENKHPTFVNETLLPANTEDSSGPFGDSGCDISNAHAADTPESLLPFSQSRYGYNNSTSDPWSSVELKLTSSCALTSKSLVCHMQFLQRFLELRKLTEGAGLKTNLKKLGRDYSVIYDSFCQLLDGLISSYSLPELTFPEFMTQAVCVITKLLSDADLSSHVLRRFLKKLEDSVKRFVTILLSNNHLNRFQMQDSVSRVLVSIGRFSIIRNFTVSLLFREVIRFSNELQRADETQATYSIQYENIFFLCNILEQLLGTGMSELENVASSGCEEEKKKFLQNLDQAIFHLSDAYPLFCIYLWRLGTLLNAAQIQTREGR